ncbi:chaperone protein TorD [Phycisphaerae bacterium RAS1]|nr:chaperone protein TorD [Phycisphaerae bacterium RAS1]
MASAMLESEGPESAVNAARRSIYDFLAGCFTRPPTPQDVAAVRSGDFRGVCAGLHRDDVRRTQVAPRPASESLSEIHLEFMNLLNVPGGKYLAPFESVYRDSREIEGQAVRGLLMGQSAVDVQKWYRLAALDFESDCKELPDHIGLELAYVAHLCRKEQDFEATGDAPRLSRAREMQRDFLAAHVDSWLGALRDRLYDKSTSAHYRTIVDFALGFVRADLASLERELGPSARSSAPVYRAAPAEGSSHEQD